MRRSWLALFLGLAACSPLLDLDGYDYVDGVSTSVAATGGAGGTGGGSSAGGSGGGAGAVAGMGGSGDCGDGVIGPDEECDDGDSEGGDGCSEACVVECTGTGYTKDPATFHCYFYDPALVVWDVAHDACLALGDGWDLAAISNLAERDFEDAMDLTSGDTFAWLGGRDETEGVYLWSNGEVWSSEADSLLSFIDGDIEDCIQLYAHVGSLNDDLTDDECAIPTSAICELTPAGR